MDDGDEEVVSTDDGGTARRSAIGVHRQRWRRGAGSRQNFGSVTAQEKNPGVRVKGRRVGA
jgi:hypothetical protein